MFINCIFQWRTQVNNTSLAKIVINSFKDSKCHRCKSTYIAISNADKKDLSMVLLLSRGYTKALCIQFILYNNYVYLHYKKR